MKRVLVVTNNALRKTNANGTTFINLLSTFDKDEVITFSIDGAIPDKGVAIAHYKTTDSEHLKNFFRKKNLGKTILDSELKEEKNISNNVGKHKSIKESSLGLAIREFIWKHGRWDKTGLYNFIETYKPSIILFQCSRTIFMVNLVKELSIMFNIPIMIYTGEDEYFHKYPFYKLIKNSLQRKMKKAYKEMFKNVKQVICTQSKLEKKYHEEFKVDSTTIMPACSFEVNKEPIINKNGHIMYIGNINPNRYDSLVEFSNVLSKIDNSIVIDVYSGDITIKVRKLFSKHPNIVINDPVSKKEIPSLMKKARLLIHVESFKKKDKVLIENGFSTKIPDSLASGVPFILYGPSYCGFSYYFQNATTPRYIDNFSSLEDILYKSLNDEEYIISLVKEGFVLAKNNHNKELNSKKLHSLLKL